MMVEVIGNMYGFTWEYDPPADGQWGAVQENGMMSGLIGQAGITKKKAQSLKLHKESLLLSLWCDRLGSVWCHGDARQMVSGRQSSLL